VVAVFGTWLCGCAELRGDLGDAGPPDSPLELDGGEALADVPTRLVGDGPGDVGLALSSDVTAPVEGPCPPGERRACACELGVAEQLCRDDGLGWDPCPCFGDTAPVGPADGGVDGRSDAVAYPIADGGDGRETGAAGAAIQTCRERLDCIGRCGSDACQTRCYARADAEPYERYRTMLRCWGQRCAAVVGDSEAFDACTQSRCADETRACLGD